MRRRSVRAGGGQVGDRGPAVVADDSVAPVGDAGALAQALRRRGLLAGMLKFEEVGHYLSDVAQRQALDAELALYRAVLNRDGMATPE
ncbi:hypothetical protein GCM10022255_085470 [Dactylosporangium darangshiense]|uniref:Uncharacterized protein n=1 Tax=Dactylosporangium darangshiense TaxID=579108 RepID=A0ABP8DMX8_9ACTN